MRAIKSDPWLFINSDAAFACHIAISVVEESKVVIDMEAEPGDNGPAFRILASPICYFWGDMKSSFQTTNNGLGICS